MKTTILKTVAILFLAILTTSCIKIGLNKITGNKNVVTKNRKTHDNFTKIKTSNGLEVYITQGKKTTIVVEADENLHEIIQTEIIGGVLRIYTDKNIGRAKSKKIYVTLPKIESIKAGSGSYVVSENTLKATTFSAKTNSGAQMKLTVDVDVLISSSSSGSHLKLTGNANEYDASTSSGASTKSYNLKSKEVTVSASSGATIDVFATDAIIARASSGGDVDYKGNPTKVKIKKSSGGSVSSH